MKFIETPLKDSYIIEIEPIADERGFFARTWCENEFKKRGLNPKIVQCNISFNNKKGTLRGMHYQAKPHEEAKLVRCTRGSIYDVIIDLREDSSSYKQWFGIELNQENNKMLYIPEGFAHGFQTLENNSEVFYQMSNFYYPESSKGVSYKDPCLKISWPLEITLISEKDRLFPNIS